MRVLKTVWKILSDLLVLVVILLAIALVGVRLFGLKPFSVLSGSMEPTYRTGSIIYVREVDYKTLEVGDPITFMLDENTVVTHRIIEVLPDEEDPEVIRYFTKGDNNKSPDGSSVHCMNILGKPVFTIPYLGYVADFVQKPPGRYYMIAASVVILLLAFLPDLLEEKPREQEQQRGRSRKKKK